MVERKPVSVNWQTLFVLVPFVDLWATYRIQKLRLYLLIFAVGFGLIQFLISATVNDPFVFTVMQDDMTNFEQDPQMEDLLTSDVLAIIIIIEIIEFIARIYLIRRWSGEWNFKVRGYFGS